jgi:glycosyltransferase involved in cell wall biosynthesis
MDMNQSNRSVSVVMPSYNQGRFIEKSIRSVLEQSDVSNIELIISDGGSTDSTLSILKALNSEFDNKIKWISEPDNGPAHAINKALRKAKGGIIGWLNSDDLYAEGAIKRAVDFFQSQTEKVMLYGRGQHIDKYDAYINDYPTKLPSEDLTLFQQGCYICQPTVFFRREVIDNVGYLDDTVKTAFDFEYWLRVFKHFVGKIAYIDEVQAYSRLHDDCITQSQRLQVALDGMEVLSRHLGDVKPHWLLTYVNELCEYYPFEQSPKSLNVHVSDVLEQVKGYLSETDFLSLQQQLLVQDQRVLLSSSNIYANLYPDGWTSENLDVRVRTSGLNGRKIILTCYHASPVGQLNLAIVDPVGNTHSLSISQQGVFYIPIDLPLLQTSEFLTAKIKCKSFFVPAIIDKNSIDTRKLGFKITKIFTRD